MLNGIICNNLNDATIMLKTLQKVVEEQKRLTSELGIGQYITIEHLYRLTEFELRQRLFKVQDEDYYTGWDLNDISFNLEEDRGLLDISYYVININGKKKEFELDKMLFEARKQ